MQKKWKVRIISTAIGIGTVVAIAILDALTSSEITTLLIEKFGPAFGTIAILLITEVVKAIRNEYKLGKLGARKEDDDVILV